MPVSVQVGSSTYWLQSNGQWTKDQAGSKPLTGSALIAAQQAYAAQGGSGPPAGQGSGGEATGAAGGPGAVPVQAPVPVTMPGLTSDTRFGSYSSPAYDVGQSYAGPQPITYTAGGAATPPAGTSATPGGPSPSSAPASTPTPTPQPAPSPAPAAAASPTAQPGRGGGLLRSGNGGGMGGAGLLSSGGATTAAAGGGSGGNAPAGGTYGPGSGIPSPSDYVSLGWPGQLALTAAANLPGVYGIPGTLLSLGLHGANTATSDSLNQGLGMGGLDLGQVLGGVLGLNRYGSLSDPLIANADAVSAKTGGQLNAGISPGGIYDPGFVASLLGDTLTTEYTPDEYAKRQYALQHQATLAAPAAAAATPAAPAKPSASTAAARTPVYRNDGTLLGYVGDSAADAAIAAGRATASTGSAVSNNGSYASASAGQGGNSFGSYGGSYGPNDRTAIGASGQLGHIATGGYIGRGGQVIPAARTGDPRLRSDGRTDNQPMMTDEGEFVLRRAAARALGPGLLHSLNDPRQARRIRGLLRSVA